MPNWGKIARGGTEGGLAYSAYKYLEDKYGLGDPDADYLDHALDALGFIGRGNIANTAIGKALGIEDADYGVVPRIANTLGLEQDNIPLSILDIASYLHPATATLNLIDGVKVADEQNRQKGYYDSAENRDITQRLKTLKEHYDRNMDLYKDNPKIQKTFTDKYNKDKSALESIIDYNTPYQQKINVVNTDNTAKTLADISEDVVSDLPKSVDKKNNKVFYKDIDLNSDAVRQIFGTSDMKRSLADYANRADLSQEEKERRAIADVIAWRNRNGKA